MCNGTLHGQHTATDGTTTMSGKHVLTVTARVLTRVHSLGSTVGCVFGSLAH